MNDGLFCLIACCSFWIFNLIDVKKKEVLMLTNCLPIVLGFCFQSGSISRVGVVSAPDELALAVYLRGLVAQEDKAIIIHSDLNVFGS